MKIFQPLTKHSKRKEGQKFISTLTHFDAENDSVFNTQRGNENKQSPNKDYFSTEFFKRQPRTLSSRVEDQKKDDLSQQHAKTLQYFKQKINHNFDKLPTQSTLITATSFSNKNLNSPKSIFFQNDLQNEKNIKSSFVKPQQTHHSIFSEDAHDYEIDNGDQIILQKSSQSLLTLQAKERSSTPNQEFKNSQQVLEKYVGNISHKQLQISKLININEQVAKDRIKQQIQKHQSVTERLDQNQNQIKTLPLNQQNGSIISSQSNDQFQILNLNKPKSRSQLLTNQKHNSFNSIIDERSQSFTISNPQYFNKQLQNKKNSLFELTSNQRDQIHLGSITEYLPIKQKIQNLDQNYISQTERVSQTSATLNQKRSLTNDKKINQIKSIFQKEGTQIEPLQNNNIKQGSENSQGPNKSNGFSQRMNLPSQIPQQKVHKFGSQRMSNPFERISKMKIDLSKKAPKRLTSPFHRSQLMFEKMQSKLNTPFADISQKISFNIVCLKRFFKNDARVFKYLQTLLKQRHDSLVLIFIKNEKKQELYDNVVAIENNISENLKQYEQQKKSHMMKLKQQYTQTTIFIDQQHLMRELQYLYDDLEKLCLHKMKDKINKAFEGVSFTDKRIEENILDLQKSLKPVPLEFQDRKYLYMNENILYIPEKFENFEKSHGEFTLISHEARLLAKEIETNICKLKQIDRDQRNPFRKQVIDSTQK